jgi:phage terminase small subunit
MPLTPRRLRFVDEYLIDLDARAAARRAGFSPKTRSYTTKLMRDPDVARAIGQAMTERAQRTGITRERVLAEYAKIAFIDLSDLAAWDGAGVALKDAAAIPEEIAAAIALVAELDAPPNDAPAGNGAEGGAHRFRVSLFDKLKALDALARLIDPHWKADVLVAPIPLPDRFH